MRVDVTLHGQQPDMCIWIRFEEPPSMEWAIAIESHLRSRVPAVNELVAWVKAGRLTFFSLNSSRVPDSSVLVREVNQVLAELPY
jgi:hypothetical protein